MWTRRPKIGWSRAATGRAGLLPAQRSLRPGRNFWNYKRMVGSRQPNAGRKGIGSKSAAERSDADPTDSNRRFSLWLSWDIAHASAAAITVPGIRALTSASPGGSEKLEYQQ